MSIKKPMTAEEYRATVQANLDERAEAAERMAKFLFEAINRKFVFDIRVEVGGVGVNYERIHPAGKLAEFLANWACRERMLTKLTADRYRKGEDGSLELWSWE